MSRRRTSRSSSSVGVLRVASVVVRMPPPSYGSACHPGGELLGPVAGEHEVGVGVDEAGQDAGAVGIDAFVGDLAGRPDV